MANRPRRPRPGQKPEAEASDLSTEAGVGPDSIGIENEDREPTATTASPGDIDPLATGDATAVHATSVDPSATSDADKPDTAIGAPSLDASPTGRTLPAPENQPSILDDARKDDLRTQAAGAGSAAGAAGTFAEREGFAGERERDLGEFEDDETVLAAAEPAEPAHVEPYSDPHDYAASGGSAPSFGSLLGAGLVGGLIAAALGVGLLYSGMIPVGARQQQAAEQYAPAGEMQAVRGEVQSLTERLEQLQSAQAAGGATTEYVSASELTALTDRVTAAERAVQANTDGGAGTTASIEELRTAIEDARSTAASASERAGSAEAAASQASEAVTAFGPRLDAIEAANEQAMLAFAAAGLKAAIDRGGPFMPELESFAAASGNTEDVAALRDFAASGVPTLAALVDAWPETEAEMLAAIRAPEAGDNVGAQVLSGLGSLVTVRPSEGAPPSEEGGEAVVSRMRAALQSGDLGAWQSEYDQLPDAAKTAGESFAADVAARRQAMEIVDEALAGASAAATGSQEG